MSPLVCKVKLQALARKQLNRVVNDSHCSTQILCFDNKDPVSMLEPQKQSLQHRLPQVHQKVDCCFVGSSSH